MYGCESFNLICILLLLLFYLFLSYLYVREFMNYVNLDVTRVYQKSMRIVAVYVVSRLIVYNLKDVNSGWF